MRPSVQKFKFSWKLIQLNYFIMMKSVRPHETLSLVLNQYSFIISLYWNVFTDNIFLYLKILLCLRRIMQFSKNYIFNAIIKVNDLKTTIMLLERLSFAKHLGRKFSKYFNFYLRLDWKFQWYVNEIYR